MQSIIRPAARRETLVQQEDIDRRGGGLEMLFTMPYEA
jgi:hypothetical protein